VEKGLISKEVLDELLEQQKEALSIGELAIKLQMMTELDLVRALSYKNSGRAIGEILIDNGAIRPEDLSAALKKHNKRKEIGEILVRQGMLDSQQLQQALVEQNQSKDRLGIFLVKKGLISYHQLYNALSHQYNIPYLGLSDFSYNQIQKNKLIKFVSEKYARRNVLLPLTLENKKLFLGVTYPEGLEAIDELRLIYRNLTMDAAFINEEKFETLYAALYDTHFQPPRDDSDPLEKHDGDVNLFNFQKLTSIEKSQATQIYTGMETEIKKIVDYIINYGVSMGASDIHFEQDRQGVKLRYRIDGICQDPQIPWIKEKLTTKPESVISRIKVMSNLDISERRIPQDGVFRASYKENKKTFDLDFRVATCPAIVGENVTIRILDSRKAGLGLDTLNHSKFVLDPLKRLIKSPAGMILVTGPTGSGKSSTLYGVLREINGPEIKIITAEDPIEYSFPGIMQTQINTKIDLTFARLLRSFLRLDPDVILVGEIRDRETASISFDAAQTGHLLLSTLHTIDSISSITRLLDLGIDHNQIASNLIGVLSQRLARKNCSKCSRSYKPPKTEWNLFFKTYPDHISFYKGIGCKACDFTGYSGRTLISELLVNNQKMTLAVSCRESEQTLRKIAIKSGMKTMADDGMMKMSQINLSELIRVLPLDMIKDFKSRH
jgi:type IV pilus assembly protein PilB